MPFITEEIYHLLTGGEDDICIRQFTVIRAVNDTKLAEGELLKQAITAIRDARTKNGIKMKEEISVAIETDDIGKYQSIRAILSKQINASEIQLGGQEFKGNLSLVIGKDKIHVSSSLPTDRTAQKEQLEKELTYQKGFLAAVLKKLANERFVQNARPEVVELERKKQADAEGKIKAIEESLAGLR